MTLLLKTTSHGHIESGFFSILTAQTRIGDYAVFTDHFYQMIVAFGEDPELRLFGLPAFSTERYEQLAWAGIHASITSALSNVTPELARAGREQSLDEAITNMKIKYPILKEVEPLLFLANEKGTEMTIGKYVVPGDDFFSFCTYLENGGIFGYPQGQRPLGADIAKRAMELSKNPIFAQYRT